MSKPVTHEEVEDVLSSIRRLVSEDKRPLAGLRAAPVVSAPPVVNADADPVAERLVLTPALRVAPAVQDADTGEVTDIQAPVVSEPVAQTGASDAEGPLDLGSVASEIRHPDPVAPDAVDDVETLVLEALEAQANAAEALVEGDYGAEEYWDADESGQQQAEFPAEEPPADAADAARDLTAAGGDPVNDSATTAGLRPADPEICEDLPSPEAQAVRPDANLADVSPGLRTAATADKVVPLTARIAALEAAVDQSVQDWEPDGDWTEDLNPQNAPAMAWQDDVELDARGVPLTPEAGPDIDASEPVPGATAQQSAQPPTGVSFGADDQLMDEDTLRDLVSEIVRAELQGALGERITRNVRKLVRREIHRALTAQEME
jgi:hypothetical protein